jgi:hypothetical protein
VKIPPTFGQLNDEVIISAVAIKANLPFVWNLIGSSSAMPDPTRRVCAQRTRPSEHFNRANFAEFRHDVGCSDRDQALAFLLRRTCSRSARLQSCKKIISPMNV